MSEQVFAATPVSAAGGRVIASPFQFYTTGEDNLRVVTSNSLVGVRLKIQGRFIDSAGRIGAASWDHAPTSDRSVTHDDYSLGVGAVLNLTVFASAGTPQIGQTFVIVQLVRGIGPAAIVLGTLLQGYVTSSQGLGWPGSPIQSSIEGGGYLRTIAGATPALGAISTETVPTGARWQLLTYRARTTTNALGGPRGGNVLISDGANLLVQSINPLVINPSESTRWFWAVGMPIDSTSVPFQATAGLPTDLPLSAGHQIILFATGFDPGDQFTEIFYRVREWLEVL